MRVRRNGGFTLAEIACVVGIGSILAGLVTAGGMYAKKASEHHSAQAGVTTLEAAVNAFQAKRGTFPKDLDADGTTTADEIVNQLQGWNILAKDFSPVDPWGRPYVIVLRRDYGYAAGTMYDYNLFPLNDTPDGFQVYSVGPDGATSTVCTDEAALDDIANFRM
jgi:prepilin-type N-terminal cleavage/methylation domain-containing protein